MLEMLLAALLVTPGQTKIYSLPLRALWLSATSPCSTVNFATFHPSFPEQAELFASPLDAGSLGQKER